MTVRSKASSLRGYLSLGANVVHVSRDAAAHCNTGAPGQYMVELAITGLSDGRRQEIVDAFAEHLGVEPLPPAGDGKLHLFGWTTPGFSSQASAVTALWQWADIFAAINFSPAELVGTEMELTVRPTTKEPPEGALPKDGDDGRTVAQMIFRRALIFLFAGRRRAERHASRVLHGLHAGYADNWDRIAMMKEGERTYNVATTFNGPAEQVDAVRATIATTFGSPGEDIADDTVGFNVGAGRVGTPYGAILLSVRKLADFLDLLPADITMTMWAKEIPVPADAA